MKTGIINVNKPSGVSSGFVVNKLKRLTHCPCGHMGTLDPLASGVLPVGVGNATRLFNYFLEKKKQSIAEFRFGVTSDTLDSTGEIRVEKPYIILQRLWKSVITAPKKKILCGMVQNASHLPSYQESTFLRNCMI